MSDKQLYYHRRFSFDKLVAGLCMGELCRLVLDKLTNAHVLFNGIGSEPLFERNSFPTKYISEILRYVSNFIKK